MFNENIISSLKDKPSILAIDGAINKNGIAFNISDKVYSFVLESDKSLSGTGRLIDLGDKLESVLKFNIPMYAVVEGYSFGSIGRTFSISEAGGIYRYLLGKYNIPTIEVPPTTLKKYITGDGKSDKKKMALSIKSIFDISFKTNDETDAFSLLVTAMDYFNTPLSPIESFNDYLMSKCKLIYGENTNITKELKVVKRLTKKQQQIIKEERDHNEFSG